MASGDLAQGGGLNVGICGYGTVGGGTWQLLRDNRALLARRLGMPLRVSHIASRGLGGQAIDGVPTVSTEPLELANDPQVDVMVEAMGGVDDAFTAVAAALGNGKPVVTANKALVAERGNELIDTAARHGTELLFEAAVAGGIPIIKTLREGLAGNRIDRVVGIINGTANYILHAMAVGGVPFAEALRSAQEKGYAEADPSFDVEGIDAAHKLAILAAIAFDTPLRYDAVYREGITSLTPADMAFARQLGYRIKHLGIARREADGLSLRVHPALVSRKEALSAVDGVENAVQVHGNATGVTRHIGPGAGALATASAVVADIVDVARARQCGARRPRVPALGHRETAAAEPMLPMEEVETACYLRVPARDAVGTMARVTGVLEANEINIETVLQKGQDDVAAGESTTIVILTHLASERNINRALDTLGNSADVIGAIARVRIEG